MLRNYIYNRVWTSKAGAAKAVNAALSEMYTGDMWLSPIEATRIANRGLYFLRAYAKLAYNYNRLGLTRFPLYPKAHMLFHTFYGLLVAAKQGKYSLNAVCESCPQDEDFVGRVSRISRRCGTRAIQPSALRKYLIHCRTVWTYELY